MGVFNLNFLKIVYLLSISEVLNYILKLYIVHVTFPGYLTTNLQGNNKFYDKQN